MSTKKESNEKIKKSQSLKLSKRPKKEEAVNKFQDWISTNVVILTACGIAEKTVRDWAAEPWSYSSIKTAVKFVETTLKHYVNRLIELSNKKTTEEWQTLRVLSRNHDDILLLNRYKREVVAAWNKRPRFPQDAGRTKQESY